MSVVAVKKPHDNGDKEPPEALSPAVTQSCCPVMMLRWLCLLFSILDYNFFLLFSAQ